MDDIYQGFLNKLREIFSTLSASDICFQKQLHSYTSHTISLIFLALDFRYTDGLDTRLEHNSVHSTNIFRIRV